VTTYISDYIHQWPHTNHMGYAPVFPALLSPFFKGYNPACDRLCQPNRIYQYYWSASWIKHVDRGTGPSSTIISTELPFIQISRIFVRTNVNILANGKLDWLFTLKILFLQNYCTYHKIKDLCPWRLTKLIFRVEKLMVGQLVKESPHLG
jgi:hypothetical protein